MKLKIQACLSVYKKTAEQVLRCIDSIPESYLIRVDIDGGWDSGDLIKAIAGNTRIDKLEIHSTNLGLGKVRNLQLSECNYPYIQFIDSDDKLNSEVEIFDYEKYSFIVSPVKLITNKGEFDEFRNVNIVSKDSNWESFFVIPSIVFNTEFLKFSHLKFDDSGNTFEDVLFSIELTKYKEGTKVGIHEIPYYVYNIQSEGTLSTENTNSLIESTTYVLDQLRSKYKLKEDPIAFGRYVEEASRLISYGRSDLTLEFLKPYKL